MGCHRPAGAETVREAHPFGRPALHSTIRIYFLGRRTVLTLCWHGGGRHGPARRKEAAGGRVMGRRLQGLRPPRRTAPGFRLASRRLQIIPIPTSSQTSCLLVSPPISPFSCSPSTDCVSSPPSILDYTVVNL